jgi:hypothetical protein
MLSENKVCNNLTIAKIADGSGRMGRGGNNLARRNI